MKDMNGGYDIKDMKEDKMKGVRGWNPPGKLFQPHPLNIRETPFGI